MPQTPAHPAAKEDWLLAALEDLQRAIETARAALSSVGEALEQSHQQRTRGMPLPVIIDVYLRAGGEETRHRAEAALRDYQRAFRTLRSGLFKELVQDHGYTFTDVAGKMGVSRQLVTRLLEAGRSETSGHD